MLLTQVETNGYVESMASGTPALALAACGAVDALGDGDFGVLVEEFDIAPAICRVILTPADRWHDLSERTHTCFGRMPLEAHVHTLVEILLDISGLRIA